jgi:nitroreductase
MKMKPAITATPIDAVLAKRWSPRAFDPTKDINATQLHALLEAARWAPSCFGDQPWYYLVCQKSTQPKAWEAAFDCLDPFNQNWVKNVPLILFSIAKNTFHHNGEPNRWAQHDTGAASENMCLQAASMGLAAHQMGGFDSEKVIKTFNVPTGFTPMAAMAVGHQAHADILPEDLQKGELSERARDPIEKHFFNGMWGEGMS